MSAVNCATVIATVTVGMVVNMDFTDTDLSNIKIKKQHLHEMQSAIQNIIDTKKVTNVSIGTLNFDKPTSDSYTKIQNAINALESSFSNNCCQSCQSSVSCQSCQACQSVCICDCDCSDDANNI